jgi:hypothetical protein
MAETAEAASGPTFDVYGYRFRLFASEPTALDGLRQDFAFFSSSPRGDERAITLDHQAPDYDRLPKLRAARYTPRNVVYRGDRIRYVDYHGRGLGEHDEVSGSFHIWSEDPGLLYEAAYLFILSQCGEFLDSRGLHRVHALGLSLNGRAILVLLPMGGGKSTLAYDLLKYPELKLLSDDSPLIDNSGKVHAFPLRLGLLPDHIGEVPEEHRRMIDRMEFGPKLLVNHAYFADRVTPGADPGLVLLGSRSLSRECRIERVSGLTGVRKLVTNCVVGLGLFQGMEFVLDRGLWALTSLGGTAASRLRNSVELVKRSIVCDVSLGRDRKANAQAIAETAERLLT